MSDAWLILVIGGLSLDIAGVIILTGPILKINYKNYDTLGSPESFNIYHDLEKSFKLSMSPFDKSDNDLQILSKKSFQKLLILQLSSIHTLFEMLIINSILQDRQRLRSAVFGLIVIIIGFFLQIIGNWIK